jgi:hypothetical protein
MAGRLGWRPSLADPDVKNQDETDKNSVPIIRDLNAKTFGELFVFRRMGLQEFINLLWDRSEMAGLLTFLENNATCWLHITDMTSKKVCDFSLHFL